MFNRADYYYLDDNKRAIPCTLAEWADNRASLEKRQVDWKVIDRRYIVSTVFLGIDHNYNDDGPPLIFETMVFNVATGWMDIYCTRCSTWEEAVEMQAVAMRKYMKTSLKKRRPTAFLPLYNDGIVL